VAILNFLRDNDSRQIYLIGDIIDGWRLSQKLFWPQTHNDVVQKLLKKVKAGTRVIYTPGNHDSFLRPYIGHSFGGIEIVDEAVHTTTDGRTFLVLHGDRFDTIVQDHKWLAYIGDFSYNLMMVVNRWLMRARHRLGYQHWSFSAYVKRRVKQAASFITKYEHALADECRRRGFDGVISGHIHTAEIRAIDTVMYLNCGDTCESCTVLVEDFHGNFMVLQMLEQNRPSHVYCQDGEVLTGAACTRWFAKRADQRHLTV
jgi:UDP-2,3-diacylglucosamine pyrophosphatase LpxH